MPDASTFNRKVSQDTIVGVRFYFNGYVFSKLVKDTRIPMFSTSSSRTGFHVA